MYYPKCLEPFPEDLADSLLEQALGSLGWSAERLDGLSEADRVRLDETVWRLVTAADVSDTPCGD